jgi:hypothetical protein
VLTGRNRWVCKYLTRIPATIKQFEKYLIPIMEERWAQEKELGEAWNDKKPVRFR